MGNVYSYLCRFLPFQSFFFLFLCFFRFLFPSFLFSLLAGSLLHFFFSFFFVRSLPDSFIPRFIPVFFLSGFSSSWSTAPLWNVTPSPPTILSQSSNHVFFLAGRWSTSGWGGNAHFFTYTRIRSRETGENRKTNEQTKLGVNQEQKRGIATLHACADYR